MKIRTTQYGPQSTPATNPTNDWVIQDDSSCTLTVADEPETRAQLEKQRQKNIGTGFEPEKATIGF